MQSQGPQKERGCTPEHRKTQFAQGQFPWRTRHGRSGAFRLQLQMTLGYNEKCHQTPTKVQFECFRYTNGGNE